MLTIDVAFQFIYQMDDRDSLYFDLQILSGIDHSERGDRSFLFFLVNSGKP